MTVPISIDSTILGLRKVIAALEKIKAAGGFSYSQKFCDLADLLDVYKQRLLIFAAMDAREAQKGER